MSLFILTIGCIIQRSNFSDGEAKGFHKKEEYPISMNSSSINNRVNTSNNTLIMKYLADQAGVFYVLIQVKHNFITDNK